MDIKLPLKIFTVDPATGKSGWALLELISLAPLRIKILKTGQLDGQKLQRQNKDMLKIFQSQYCILDALYEEYVALLTEYKPDIVVSESAYGYSHMSALISLTLAINTLRRACHKVLGIDLVTTPPTISKKALADHGGADKDMMRKAFYSVPFLIMPPTSETISEHEIDAVAHGTGYVRRDIIGDVVQISAKDLKKARREKQKEKEKQNG